LELPLLQEQDNTALPLGESTWRHHHQRCARLPAAPGRRCRPILQCGSPAPVRVNCLFSAEGLPQSAPHHPRPNLNPSRISLPHVVHRSRREKWNANRRICRRTS